MGFSRTVWVAIPFCRRSPQLRDRLHYRQIVYGLSPREALVLTMLY